MTKNFGMKFVNKHGVPLAYTSLYPGSRAWVVVPRNFELVIEIACEFYVHPNSESILMPMEGDVVLIPFQDMGRKSFWTWRESYNDVLKHTTSPSADAFKQAVVFSRDFKPFIWPEKEIADDNSKNY